MLNFHYENAGVLWEATDIAARRHPDVRFVVLESALPELTSEETEEIFHGDFPGWDVEHASMAETSMMLVFEPRLVRRDLIADDQAARRPAWEVIPPRADTIPESGVFWRPSTSSAEAGERLVEICVRQLVDAIRPSSPEPRRLHRGHGSRGGIGRRCGAPAPADGSSPGSTCRHATGSTPGSRSTSRTPTPSTTRWTRPSARSARSPTR